MHRDPWERDPRETEIPPLSGGISGYARRSKPDARAVNARASSSGSQPSALERLVSPARLATYLCAADGDLGRASDLYLWAGQLAGALHGQIAFVEIAVRNALDLQLTEWNARKGSTPDWSTAGATVEPLYALLRRQLADARSRAAQEASDRHAEHPRSGTVPSHDDVVAQLMFGSWVKLIRPVSRSESPARQQLLWGAALSAAFPGASSNDSSRQTIGLQLETLRRLRNRVAHHDNLLQVDVRHRLNGMLALLASLDQDYPALAAARSPLRRLIKEDPRRGWQIA